MSFRVFENYATVRYMFVFVCVWEFEFLTCSDSATHRHTRMQARGWGWLTRISISFLRIEIQGQGLRRCLVGKHQAKLSCGPRRRETTDDRLDTVGPNDSMREA